MSVAAALVGVSTTVLLSAGGLPVAHAAVAPGSTERASVADETNAQAETGGFQQELAAGGSAIAFTSDSQLDDLDTGVGDGGRYLNVYVRDLVTDRTVMISRGQLTRDEPEVIGYRGPKLLSLAGQPAPVDPGEVPPDGSSYQPTISADGRYVAFVTTATNIVEEDDDWDQDIIVCDRDPDGDGTFDENKDNGERDYRYFKVTEPDYAGESDVREDNPRYPRLSDDATRIVWLDDNVPAGYRDRVRTAVLRRTPETDPGPPANISWVETPLGNEQLLDQADPDVSGDGEFIVMTATFRTPTPDPYDYEPPHETVMRVNAATGAVARVDLDPANEPIGTEERIRLAAPVISRDGSVVAFDAELWFSYPCDGTCWDRGGQPNVFVVRVGDGGAVTDSDIVSRDNAGELVNGIAPGLSGDGRFVSFVTDNLGAHDGVDADGGESCYFQPEEEEPTGSAPGIKALPPLDEGRDVRTSCQVVVRDLVTDQERLVAEDARLPGTLASPRDGGDEAGNGNTTPFETERSPSLSSDGTRIGYESDATDLVPGDTNDAIDVFVRTFRPDLRADPAPLDFGEVLVETPTTATVRFDHVGIGPLVVADLEVEGEEFTVTDQTCVEEGVLLQQAGNCLVEVEFTPPAEGTFEGVLRLTTSDEREFTVDLVGLGVLEDPDAAAFAAGPDPLNFGNRLIRANGPLATVTVTNGGETPMVVGAVTVEPPAARAHYSVVSSTCATVAPGASCAVRVRFLPTASGTLGGVLSFVDDAPGAPHLVGLTGTTPTPSIEVNPAVSQPARVISVLGKGFAPNRMVVSTVPLAVQTGPVKVAPDGTFRASILILPKASAGDKTVIAAVSGFPEINAETQLLVVTPTVGPAEFVVRG